MIAYVTRWFLFGIALFAVGTALIYFTVQKAAFPEDCQSASKAWEAGDQVLSIDYYTSCIDGGELSADKLAVAYANRGLAYSYKGDNDRALQDYDEAIRFNPDNAEAYYGRGWISGIKGDHDRAILDYSEVLRIKPDDPDAYNNRCWEYALARRPREALQDCNESIRWRPNDVQNLDSRALAYWVAGDHKKARQDLERARELDPSLPTWQERMREFEGMF